MVHDHDGVRNRRELVRVVIKGMDQQIEETKVPEDVVLLKIRRTALQLELDALDSSPDV